MKNLKRKINGWENLDIIIELNLNKNSEFLIIFLHGAYSSPYDIKKTKIQYLSEKLKGKYSTAFFQTSRKFEWKTKPALSFEEYFKNSFKGKTFNDELSDSEKAITCIISEYMNLANYKQPKTMFVGFSLGGVIATLIASEIKSVDRIITMGTSFSFKLPAFWKLISTMPSENELKTNLESFTGHFHILAAGEDDTHEVEDTFDIFRSAKISQNKSITQWPGVDHRFQKIDGIVKENVINSRLKAFIEEKINSM